VPSSGFSKDFLEGIKGTKKATKKNLGGKNQEVTQGHLITFLLLSTPCYLI